MNPAAVSAPARETRRRRGVRLAAFWDGPLGYPQAALVVLTALAIGAVFHHVVGYRARLAAPWTWLLAAGFTLAVGIAARRGREHAVVRWLTGVPFAICSLLGVGALAAVGACVRRPPSRRAGASPRSTSPGRFAWRSGRCWST
jgi:hypothetical protein